MTTNKEGRMRYLSVCSGIEAASCAWHPLGWKAVAFSEIEPFPASVLAHHYPDVPNLGDMTSFKEWNIEPIDVLVGGTPCQSFSVAGLRKGLADPRGNLMLTYLAIAERYRPEWLVWENVPGVLSSNKGRDFGTFLGGLAELRYGFAYRVLDAQYFGVAQRRRRVFVVANSRSWQRAAAVLFERESLSGHPAPSREAREGVAGTISKCSFDGGAGGRPEGAAGNHFIASTLRAKGNCTHAADLETYIPQWPAEVAPTLDAHYGYKMGLENQHINGGGDYSSTAMCLTTKVRIDAESETLIPTIGGVFSFHPTQDPISNDEISHSIGANLNATSAVAIGWSEELTASSELAGTLQYGGQGGRHDGVMTQAMQVRRLTPIECERLQGFPDNYTAIPWRGKGAADCPDGPRYKALGNSMAVPVMAWIGHRIDVVNQIKESEAA